MKSFYKIFLVLFLGCFIMSEDLKAQTNLVKNGDFTNGLQHWSFYTGSSSASSSVSGAGVVINVSSPGSNVWEPQLVQADIPMVKGQDYELIFYAKNSINGNIEVSVGTGAPNYTSTLNKSVNLTTTFTKYSYKFTSSFTDANSELVFMFGQRAQTVILDSIQLWTSGSQFQVSGYVKECGIPMQGVTMTYNSTKTTVTDSKGYYKFDVSGAGTKTFVPTKKGYVFTPDKRQLGNITKDEDSLNFSGVKEWTHLSGIVKYKSTDVPISNFGVKIKSLKYGIDTMVYSDNKGLFKYPVQFSDDPPIEYNLIPSNIEGYSAEPLKHVRFSFQYCSFADNNFEITLNPPDPCMVLFDTITKRNLIAWERPKVTYIDSYRVYRESTTAGVYELVGATDYKDISILVDQNSNPFQRAYRYGLKAVDTLGNVSAMGKIHKTMHLTANKGVGSEVNLIWTHYEGFPFSTYKIYRGTKPWNMILLDSIQSSLSSYTDLNPPSGLLFYTILIDKKDTCFPNILRAGNNSGPFSQSLSNLKDYNTLQTDYLEVRPKEIWVTKAKGDHVFKVFTNLSNWQIQGSAGWLNFTADKDNNTVTVSYDENTTGANRSAVFTLSAPEVNDFKVTFSQSNTLNGVMENSLESLKIYPNPARKKWVIRNNTNTPIISYSLYDVSGKLLSIEPLALSANGEALIDISRLTKGVYILKLTDYKSRIFNKVAIKY